MKFKVGDIVKGISNEYVVTDKRMIKGKVMKAGNYKIDVKILEHENEEYIGRKFCELNEDHFEAVPIIKPTKQELMKTPIGTKITTDKDCHNVFIKKDSNTFENDDCDELENYDINDDLSIDCCGNKIIKIEVPTYEIIYDYATETKEMTVAEIEKELGYPVKIIKED